MLQIEYISINKIKPNEYNPKRMTLEEEANLRKSIEKFGIVDPLILNRASGREGIIIGGHQRHKIYKELGFKTVPVVWIDIADIKEEKELCLRLSRNVGSWDLELLELNFDEKSLTNIGFNKSELDNIFRIEIDDNYDIERRLKEILQQERKVRKGDIWQLGNNKLLVGDCTEEKNWKRLLGEEKFDFLITDPPYRLSYAKTFKGRGKTKKGFGYRGDKTYLGVNERGSVPEYDEWLSIANKFQNSNGANIMVFENWKNTVELWQAIEKYWKIKNMIIWWVPNRCQRFPRPGLFFQKYDIAPLAGEGILNEEYEEEMDNYLQKSGQKLLDTYEVAIYGQQGKKAYWDKKKGTRWAKINDHITWVVETKKSSSQNVIFGTKPIQILIPYIKILSPRNGIVIDCFGGSGSTLISCEIMRRECRLIEYSEVYAEIIVDRWQEFTKQKAKRVKEV